jgi:hypothetical protein
MHRSSISSIWVGSELAKSSSALTENKRPVAGIAKRGAAAILIVVIIIVNALELNYKEPLSFRLSTRRYG